MLHHNIRSLNKNLHELDLILKTEIFDIVSLNETKLDDSFPIYILVRRDKSRNEGGLLFMIKKDYKIIHQDIGESNEFKIDYIRLKIKIKNKIIIL
jgi:hypothetical protein